jgi:hypothetical protein
MPAVVCVWVSLGGYTCRVAIKSERRGYTEPVWLYEWDEDKGFVSICVVKVFGSPGAGGGAS